MEGKYKAILTEVEQHDKEGKLIKESVRELKPRHPDITEPVVREARSALLMMQKVERRKSLLRGKPLSERIRELRNNAAKTNGQIAQELGVKEQTVKNHVRNNPDIPRRPAGRYSAIHPPTPQH